MSWKLDLPSIETDLLIVKEATWPAYRYDDLVRLINARHSLNRPVIVEGIFLLHTLRKINVVCDFFIYVEKEDDNSGYSLKKKLSQYDEKYSPKAKANFVFAWLMKDTF